MTTLTFSIRFHGPFAVATGVAHDGMDTTVDPHNPLPSTAIKGLLKAQLRDALGVPPTLIVGIFDAGDCTRWVFRDAVMTVEVNAWARVAVDSEGRAKERHLMVGEQAYATHGTFGITWEGSGPASSGETRALRAAARAVTSLGSHRRRGLGWVSITDPEPWTADDSTALRDWIARGASAR